MLELERKTGDSRLNFIEMALIVQVSTAQDKLDRIVNHVLNLRQFRNAASNIRHYDQQEYNAAAAIHRYNPSTFKDYADTNFRYLKATGMVQSKGKAIVLVPEKHVFVEQLVKDTTFPASDREYFTALCNGATLPTDNAGTARIVLDDLVRQANSRGIAFDTTNRPLEDAADIAIVRHEVEALLAEQKEEEYARNQAALWQEISIYMQLLIERRRSINTPDGGVSKSPRPRHPRILSGCCGGLFLLLIAW